MLRMRGLARTDADVPAGALLNPGWRVLSRGWKKLLDFEGAYQAMKGAGLVISR